MSFRWIVSTENNPYMAWQCALFLYSARTRANIDPTFIVHEDERFGHHELLWFRWIESVQGKIVRVPSYKGTLCGKEYKPRNTIGTVLEAADRFKDDFLVLCDPDMLFLKPVQPHHHNSGDRVTNLWVQKAGFRKLWLDAPLNRSQRDWLLEDRRYSVGVPHVMERKSAKDWATEWMRLLDTSHRHYVWESSMWDWGFAAARLGIPYYISHHSVTNAFDTNRTQGHAMVHYCYGTHRWGKRKHLQLSEDDPLSVIRGVPRAPVGSVDEAIFIQLRGLHNAYVASRARAREVRAR